MKQVSGWKPLFVMEAAGKTCGVLNETSKIFKSILKRKKKKERAAIEE